MEVRKAVLLVLGGRDYYMIDGEIGSAQKIVEARIWLDL
jgi:hypothetical protein